jgi:hypothetical protein
MAKGYAIRVYGRNDADKAIEAFKSVGYTTSRTDLLSVLRFETNHPTYIVIGQSGRIDSSEGPYAENNSECTILNSIYDIPYYHEGQTIMSFAKHEDKGECLIKVGDIIKAGDGSWSFGVRDGKMVAHQGIEMAKRDWKVISINEYEFPIAGSLWEPEKNPEYQNNNMVLAALDDPTFIIITNSNLSCYDRYRKQPIMINGQKVEINKGRSIKIGSMKIDAATVDAIIREWQ